MPKPQGRFSLTFQLFPLLTGMWSFAQLQLQTTLWPRLCSRVSIKDDYWWHYKVRLRWWPCCDQRCTSWECQLSSSRQALYHHQSILHASTVKRLSQSSKHSDGRPHNSLWNLFDHRSFPLTDACSTLSLYSLTVQLIASSNCNSVWKGKWKKLT